MEIRDTGDGPAIVMLSGWGQTRRAFDRLIEKLEDRFRLITFDMPGYGTARDDPGPYTLDRYCEVISDVIGQARLSRFHLLGWSMGGEIAAKYIKDKRGPLPESLILLSSPARFVSVDKDILMGAHPARAKKMEMMIRRDHKAGLRDFICRFFESGEEISPEEKVEIEKLLIPPGFPPRKEALLTNLTELIELDLTETPIEYDRPVLLISGGLDRITPIKGQRLWKRVFANVEEACIETAGHAPHLTCATRVGELVTRFMEK
ncbi:hypothetical protein MNBD_NITROSPINAE02-1510 [hydrothermal vent metagenome]|uniref:AB hydrolase-1 domain-containing protein n=1 Tax=hydrothermal vent metagenome TaxID=652676 RepID=A0A3B1C9R9_9ZZZZ